jgi:type IV secretory pathway VirJ component
MKKSLFRLAAIAMAAAVLCAGGCASAPQTAGAPWLVSVPPATIATAGDVQPPMVVWISGDGGWGKMEREVTRRLAAQGVPILGVDSLRYFLIKRDPRAVAAKIAQAIKVQDEKWRRPRLVLAGFSFGADIGPFIVRDLPPDVRQRVVLAAFLSPSKRANMRASPASWLGIGIGPEVWPVMTALQPTPVLCIGGAGVFSDICPAEGAAPPGMVSVRLGGGHQLENQYDAIAQLILAHATAGRRSAIGAGVASPTPMALFSLNRDACTPNSFAAREPAAGRRARIAWRCRAPYIS